ncbi:MAG: epoxyqueuosine reductase QueH [Candidatus Omnitrophica bacterium]|nr:epoxyqueuosine reductase QueH [Candidatus Omnitrophota bacterium]MBU4487754.1 epoxyqueuosine reductase QueH [Candidatus Omnitrophota bacterium]MCG2705712.1 epoxyqueuosine reductase QueH [Candidatus Omnitrophota bacterium]
MRVLLHVCCAPCSIHPSQELLKDKSGHVTGFFYNPNIHPAGEYEKRRAALIEYSKNAHFDVVFDKYEPEVFFSKIGIRTQAPERCKLCWQMRLEKTAESAKAGGFDAFTSTLLVSPYQDQEEIIRIGSECGGKFGVEFISADFRGGFREAQEEAKARALYRQKYCGCVFSEKERSEKRCRK